MCTPTSTSCNKSITKSVSGCVRRHSCQVCKLNGDLISGRTWAIGLGVVPPTSFAHVSSLVGLSEVTQLSLIAVAVFLACGGEPLLQFPWVDCQCAVNRGLRWTARRLLWFLLCEKGTISISYLVHTCHQKLNESTGCLHGGLAIGIRLPESVHNIPSLWLGRKTLKEDNTLKNPTIDGCWDEFLPLMVCFGCLFDRQQRIASAWAWRVTCILVSCFGGVPGGDFIHSFHSSVMPSKCRNRFRIASRSCCVSSCFCGPLSAEGKETDFPWHDDNSSPSDNSLSKILFLTGTVFAWGSEGMVLFRRLAARAKRFALSRYNKQKIQLTKRANQMIWQPVRKWNAIANHTIHAHH